MHKLPEFLSWGEGARLKGQVQMLRKWKGPGAGGQDWAPESPSAGFIPPPGFLSQERKPSLWFEPLLFGFSITCSQSILLDEEPGLAGKLLSLVLNFEFGFPVGHLSENKIKERTRRGECRDSRISTEVVEFQKLAEVSCDSWWLTIIQCSRV